MNVGKLTILGRKRQECKCKGVNRPCCVSFAFCMSVTGELRGRSCVDHDINMRISSVQV